MYTDDPERNLGALLEYGRNETAGNGERMMAHLQKIGEPLHAVYICAAAHVVNRGEDYWIAVSSGKPAMLYMIRIRTGECVHQAELTNCHNTWGVVQAADGLVYMGGSGLVYRFDPASRELVRIGTAIEGETYFWRFAADEAGRVFGGTYPGGKVWEWNIARTTFRDRGTILEGYSYARCLAVQGNRLFIGLGSLQPRLVELSTVPGAKKEIPLPDEVRHDSFVYDLDVCGDALFVRVSPSNRFYMFDLEKRKWTFLCDGAIGLEVSPPDAAGRVYMARETGLHRIDPAAATVISTGLSLPGAVKRFAWIRASIKDGRPSFAPDGSDPLVLAGLNTDGSYWLFDPSTKRSAAVEVSLQGQPIAVQSLTQDGKGAVYVGGYFAGGLVVYDSGKDELTTYKGIGQIENMAFHQGKLYMGVYTRARLYVYDPEQPWEKDVNPRHLRTLSEWGQDRPFGIASAGNYVALGTVPEYGRLGGGLFLYEPERDELESFPDLIPEQSIVCLLYRDGVLYGGTSVWGGLGIPPSQPEGLLFAWDVESRTLLWQAAPIPDERAVTALAFGPDGMLWGMTAGKLFRFNHTDGVTSGTFEFMPVDWSKFTHMWRNAFLRWREDGFLYGTAMNRFFRFDPSSGKFEVLAEDVILLADDPRGRFYFSNETELYRYDLSNEFKI